MYIPLFQETYTEVENESTTSALLMQTQDTWAQNQNMTDKI